MSQSVTLDAAKLRLCRIYERDSAKTSNDLGFLLAAIKQNLHLFDFDSFRERTASNIHLDPHESWRGLDHVQLDEDIAFATESNNSVRRLVKWRDKQFVHRDSTHVIRKLEFDKNDLPTYGDIESLLDNGMTIVNRYSALFTSHTWGSKFIGQDDYSFALDLIRDGLKFRRIALEAEYAKYGLKYTSEDAKASG